MSRFLIILLFVTAFCAPCRAAEPAFISGIWHKGHNITEPRAKSSKLMKVVEGGFLVFPATAAYRLEIQVSSDVQTPYFMRALFENPEDRSKPFTEESVVSGSGKVLNLIHGPVNGLRIGGDYRITVKIFRRKGDAEPVDVLEQKVRSYIETSGGAIKMKNGLKLQ